MVAFSFAEKNLPEICVIYREKLQRKNERVTFLSSRKEQQKLVIFTARFSGGDDGRWMVVLGVRLRLSQRGLREQFYVERHRLLLELQLSDAESA